MMNEPNPIIDIVGLRIAYRDAQGDHVVAVHNATLTLRPGTRYGLVGESGSGKSTIVRSLVGLIRPPAQIDALRFELEGFGGLLQTSSAQDRRLRGRMIAYVPQNPFGALHPILSVGEQFHRYLRGHRATSGWADTYQKAEAALLALGISDPQHVLRGHAAELSGGMAQRVVIAMSGLLRPRLIVADEPTTALDVTVQKQMLDLFASPIRDADRALLLATHDLGVVAQYCDEVFVMRDGHIVEHGAVHDVFLDPRADYTRQLLASVPGGKDAGAAV